MSLHQNNTKVTIPYLISCAWLVFSGFQTKCFAFIFWFVGVCFVLVLDISAGLEPTYKRAIERHLENDEDVPADCEGERAQKNKAF